jgi:stage V sporulation protein G
MEDMATEDKSVRESTEAGIGSQPVSPHSEEVIHPGSLEITDVRISLQSEGRLKAIVGITLNHTVAVQGLRVIQGVSGLFVALPARKRPDGQDLAIADPIVDAGLRRYLADTVLTAYRQERTRAERLLNGARRPGTDEG